MVEIELDERTLPKNRRTSWRRTTRETREVSATFDEAKREKEQPEVERWAWAMDSISHLRSPEAAELRIVSSTSHTSLGL